MKKIYLSVAAVALSLCALAQQSFVEQATGISVKHPYQPKTTKFAPIKNKSVSAVASPTASFQGRFDPSYAIPNAHGKTLGFNGTEDYGGYVDPIFCDSTTSSSFSSVAMIDGHNYGVTFDPKSIIFDPVNLNPLLTSADSYYIDTVWIGGVYQRRGNMVDDTLIVEVVWGDTANASVFNRYAYSAASPNLNAMGYWAVPKFGTSVQNGDKIRYSAPSTNRLTFKHVLTKADSTYMADVSDYLPIVLNGAAGQLIPADNIVTCAYSFNAGGTRPNGAVSWASSTAATPGTISGWAAIEWAQDVPALTAIADVTDGYDDFGTGKNGSNYILKKARYNQEATSSVFYSTGRAAFYLGYWIDFSMRFVYSPASINELGKNTFGLTQNIPNPFTKESVVKYNLTKDVNSAVFTVTDVMGRVISSENVGTTTGTHSVKLGAYAAGLYYYSLNVDGNVTTKKMIVE